ncbi:MAG: hypothetical protein GX871_03470 [Microbacteriaceae bacterium]|nr:hypothetical protein [Microbacteriaceae bacterium]
MEKTMTLRVRSVALSILAVAALTLAGCAAEPATRAPEPGPSQGSPTSGGGEQESELGVEGAEAAPPLVAAVHEEDCGWGSPKLFAAPELPSGTEGALDVVLVGAWQHTHFDTGAGYEPVGEGTDVRYVFPSTERILYCQDVEGATQQAQNAAAFTLDGTEIVLPAPASGYAVVAWDANTMVWQNHRDGSHYLLQRR